MLKCWLNMNILEFRERFTWCMRMFLLFFDRPEKIYQLVKVVKFRTSLVCFLSAKLWTEWLEISTCSDCITINWGKNWLLTSHDPVYWFFFNNFYRKAKCHCSLFHPERVNLQFWTKTAFKKFCSLKLSNFVCFQFKKLTKCPELFVITHPLWRRSISGPLSEPSSPKVSGYLCDNVGEETAEISYESVLFLFSLISHKVQRVQEEHNSFSITTELLLSYSCD